MWSKFNLSNSKLKDILTSKRRQYSDLAHRINETKNYIDSTRIEVDKKREERTAMGNY
jgi:hypothetical protein